MSTSYEARGHVAPGGDGALETHGAAFAFDATAGRRDDLPGPADLLCAALAACLLKNVERFAGILPFAYASATVTVRAEREDAPPRMARFRYRVEIVTDEPAQRVDLLHRNLRKYGTITNTLAAAADLDGEMVALPTTA